MSPKLYAASSQKTDLLLPNNNIAHAPEHAAILPGLSAPRHSLDHKGENTPCAGASIEAKNLAQEGIRGRAKPSDSSLQLPVLDEAQVGFLPSFPQPGRVLTFSLSCLFPGRTGGVCISTLGTGKTTPRRPNHKTKRGNPTN